ncbi:MAG TPA: hypothetical protein VFW33_14010 [Gemmataceae bacterium]|nr:hypothetical protein [Gemmataceae bacterium]
MVWTQEKLAQIPAQYRDFLLMLKPVVNSRKPGTILHINAIAFNQIHGALFEQYDYGPEQARELADNLHRAGYIDMDSLGFVVPTPEGEALIEALAKEGTGNGSVPPLPTFSES